VYPPLIHSRFETRKYSRFSFISAEGAWKSNVSSCCLLPCVGVFGLEQPVGVYVEPSPSDIRGPCPGLNALCNHVYLPRNGQSISGVLISSAMRTAFGIGNSINFEQFVGASIKGVEKFHDFGFGFTSLKDLTDSHNILEHDASMTRNDDYFSKLANQDPAAINTTLVDQLLSFSGSC
jgi:hypothetical protein